MSEEPKIIIEDFSDVQRRIMNRAAANAVKSCPCGKGERIKCRQHNKVKQVIVIRRDLKMRRGKEIAQGAHASMMWLTDRLVAVNDQVGPFGKTLLPALHGRVSDAEMQWVRGNFRKITCQAPTEEALHEIAARSLKLGVIAHLVIDSGLTEFGGVPTTTALAVGPDWEDLVDSVTGGLELY